MLYEFKMVMEAILLIHNANLKKKMFKYFVSDI